MCLGINLHNPLKKKVVLLGESGFVKRSTQGRGGYDRQQFPTVRTNGERITCLGKKKTLAEVGWVSSKKNGTLMNYTPPDPRVKTVTPEIGSSFICGSCGLETDSSPPISLLDMGAFIMSVLSHHHLSLLSVATSYSTAVSPATFIAYHATPVIVLCDLWHRRPDGRFCVCVFASIDIS